MNYSKAKDWIVAEDDFNPEFLGKTESIMCLGNGYLGLRASAEESYLQEKRGMFIAGTFNKFNEDEVTELPNAADLIQMEITINGESFKLDQGKIKKYWKQLNLKTGELIRNILWESPNGDEIEINFYRVVSLKNLHLIAQKVELTVLNNNATIKVSSGINGRMTNSGSQHFSDGDKRFYERKYMQFLQQTSESKIDFVLTSVLNFSIDSKEINPKDHIAMDRRRIYANYSMEAKKGEKILIEKISNVYTSRDIDNVDLTLQQLQEKALEDLKQNSKLGYDVIAKESAEAWNEKLWLNNSVMVECENEFEQLAIRFAQYHLLVMTPAHDNRMNIAAKGLSGEGYKGHTFWDTDIFILPYFTFTNPKVARSLEEYRYLSLKGARKKALENGYEGAMYPWESAWLDDGEVTPVWGAADIVTGLPTKIWSGFIEQHITADVAYGVWQYYKTTGDQNFMDNYGYEIIFDTAIFWASRLEWDEEDKRYHINHVVGPDEYKEGVDDNAFTNYMAHWNIKKAIEYSTLLKDKNKNLYDELNKKLDLEKAFEIWNKKIGLILLPEKRTDGLIPQNKTYLSLKDIDLSKYKNQENVGELFFDYSLDQVNKMQITKQADVMILFLLLEDLFDAETKKINFDYYEARTLHDSSLSLSTHCILANDIGEYGKAYDLFKRACKIDLGENKKTSDEGIHSASIGGIWQCVVFGFGGARMIDGKLRIAPHLPSEWTKLTFPIYWQGERLFITITATTVVIENTTKNKSVEVLIADKTYDVKETITVSLV